jgi:hypothetical protein
MATSSRQSVTALIVALSTVSCRRSPVNVAVVFATSWTLGKESLNDSDEAIKRNVLETVQEPMRALMCAC